MLSFPGLFASIYYHFYLPGLLKMEYKGILNVIHNLHQFMNYPTEVLSALTRCISKQDAMFHFTLPDYQHPEGLPDALAVRFVIIYSNQMILFGKMTTVVIFSIV